MSKPSLAEVPPRPADPEPAPTVRFTREAVACLLTETAALLERERSLGQKLSVLRLLSFLAFAAGAALGFTSSPWPLLWLALPGLAAFAIARHLHSHVLDRISRLEVEEAVLGERRERLAGRRRTRPPIPAGEGPRDLPSGPEGDDPEGFELEPGVLDDLDLVGGPRSLFGFLDVTSTSFGARRLLSMIRRPLLSIPAIRKRQEAVRSAAESPSFIDSLLRSLFPLRRHRFEAVPAILSAAPSFAGRPGLLLWSHLAGSAAPVLLALTCVDLRYGPLLLLSLVVNMATIGLHVKRTNQARDRLLVLGPLLDGLEGVREVLAGERPAAAAWLEALSVLEELREPGRRLRRRIRLLEVHELGLLFEALNVLTLWELRILPPAEAFLAKHRPLLERSSRGLGEIEALLALSLPLAEQPGFSLPEPEDAPAPHLSMEGLGHPLIEPERVVLNDLRLDARTPIAIITGSNMSGKSTLLKSVGMNLVLAGMGGAVEARSMRWTPLGLSSDINVRDSLDDGKSYFAVEVERVGRILQLAREGGKVLGIFDELFRGTNSAERQAIAMALIAHLRAAGGLHLIATHDPAITRLEGEVPGIVNFHFREDVSDGTMRFDYRLRPGPAPTRNAIRVLETRGYPRDLIREARERLSKIEEAAEARCDGGSRPRRPESAAGA